MARPHLPPTPPCIPPRVRCGVPLEIPLLVLLCFFHAANAVVFCFVVVVRLRHVERSGAVPLADRHLQGDCPLFLPFDSGRLTAARAQAEWGPPVRSAARSRDGSFSVRPERSAAESKGVPCGGARRCPLTAES